MHRYVVVLALSLGLFSARPALAQELWLDRPVENWNIPGLSVPQAPTDYFADERCLTFARPAETDEDLALVSGGWHLFGSYRGGWGTRVISATSGYDGMCRPMGFYDFVFVDGQYAGTLTPEPMASRFDGVGGTQSLFGDIIAARYIRYRQTDALCCPTGGVNLVTYRVERTENGPMVAPIGVSHQPNQVE